jgi:hypothetical protein
MNDTTFVLDDAFERMAASGFELPNGFVNHGPMACETLDALGCDGDIDQWARRFARIPGRGVEPLVDKAFDPRAALGDYRRLPEWIGFFQGAIEQEDWASVVADWVPRLIPALAVALFHGAIRVGHAVRAIDTADTPARRAELARALGYWAARFRPGEPITDVRDGDGLLQEGIVGAAAAGARHYLASPSIYNLHGITGAMAVELLAPHISPAAGEVALAQVRAEHAAMYGGRPAVGSADVAGVADGELARAAAASRDPHQVKLVEACRRGLRASGDGVFAAAAERVTGFS